MNAARFGVGLLIAATLAMPAFAFVDAWPAPPVPSGAASDAMTGTTTSNGVPLKLVRFVSPKTVDEVIYWYRHEWKGRLVVNRSGNGWLLGHAEGKYFMTVQLRPSRNGRETEGVAASSDFATALRERHSHAESVARWSAALPYGTQVLSHSSSEDHLHTSEHVALRNRSSLRENESRLQALMKERGLLLQRRAQYDEAPAASSARPGGALLFFKGNGHEASAVIAPSERGDISLVVSINKTREVRP